MTTTVQDPRPLIADAERRLARGDARGAHAACLGALAADPQAAGAYHVLGLIAADHGNARKAVELFERAEALEPTLARHPAQRARGLLMLNRHDAARSAAERGASLAPADAHTLDTLGVVFTRLGLHARALPFFEQASARVGDNASYQYNLASARQFTGDLAGAEAAYRAAVALDPDLYKAWSALAQLRRQTPDDNLLAELAACLALGPDEPDRALHMGHALGKAYEDLGDPARAMQALAAGKTVKRRTLGYDAAAEAPLFEAAARTWRATAGAAGHPSREPIFVVGLPRTGTTLVDRILSSHPDVTSAGELTNFALLLKRMTGTPGALVLDPPTLEAASRAELAELGRAYVDSTRPLTGATPRFVDKMPLNVFYAGLILRALPDARVVCLRRHPLDSVLSNYRQLFATRFPFYDYAFDLADAARYYVRFDRLVTTWRAELPPDRFVEVAYEDLVADQEGQTRRLLAFCDLAWDPRCLAFHENAAPVATASSAQVRRPMYSGSSGRWRRYGDLLEPARAVLAEAGLL